MRHYEKTQNTKKYHTSSGDHPVVEKTEKRQPVYRKAGQGRYGEGA